eukprot:gene19047-30464_t
MVGGTCIAPDDCITPERACLDDDGNAMAGCAFTPEELVLEGCRFQAGKYHSGVLADCILDGMCNNKCKSVNNFPPEQCGWRIGGKRDDSGEAIDNVFVEVLFKVLGVDPSCNSAEESKCLKVNYDGALTQTYTEAFGPVSVEAAITPQGYFVVQGDVAGDDYSISMHEAGVTLSASIALKWNAIPTQYQQMKWSAKYHFTQKFTLFSHTFMAGPVPIF